MPADSAWIWPTFLTAWMAAGLWEALLPWRPLVKPLLRRWASHGLLYGLSDGVLIMVVPAGGIGLAAAFQHSPYGLLNRQAVPMWLNGLIAVLLLDLVRYAIHYCLHSFGPLWRFHQVHHSDPDLDITTGL